MKKYSLFFISLFFISCSSNIFDEGEKDLSKDGFENSFITTSLDMLENLQKLYGDSNKVILKIKKENGKYAAYSSLESPVRKSDLSGKNEYLDVERVKVEKTDN